MKRQCKVCGIEKPLKDFVKRNDCRYGRGRCCKRCEAKRVRLYYAKHPERKKAAARRDYERHGDEIRRRVRAYARENKAVVLARKTDYRRRNAAAHRAAARARKKGLTGATAVTIDYMELVASDPCVYCGMPSEQVDHIDALAYGGKHDWTNMAPACGRCNRAKYTRPLLAFLLEA